MPITGGIKFFTQSLCSSVNGGVAVASTGNNSALYSIDRNPFTVWRSVGSNDTISETLTITFPSSTFSRLFLVGHNLKDFNVKYGPPGYATDFASVIGLDGSLASIIQTVFADNTAYYEFDPVTTTGIRITALKTQVANQEKYISQVVLVNELGTILGFPVVEPISVNRNLRVNDMLSGRKSIVKAIETFGFKLQLNPYPSSYGADLDLLMSLSDRESAFQSWLCGGKRGASSFGYTVRGFRLQDLIPVQISEAIELSYLENLYIGPVKTEFQFQEATL